LLINFEDMICISSRVSWAIDLFNVNENNMKNVIRKVLFILVPSVLSYVARINKSGINTH